MTPGIKSAIDELRRVIFHYGGFLTPAEEEAATTVADFAARHAEPAPAEPVRHGYYVASRVARAGMWRGYRDAGLIINSTWIDEAGDGETADFGELWTRIVAEISRSEALLLYAETEDFPLKGALVEVGIALACGIPVFACLPRVPLEGRTMRPVGSWLAHPLVRQVHELRSVWMGPAPADHVTVPVDDLWVALTLADDSSPSRESSQALARLRAAARGEESAGINIPGEMFDSPGEDA